MQLTLVLNVLKHDFVIQLGAGVTPEDTDENEDKELVVIESTGDHTVRTVGFVRNDDEEEEDDKYRVLVRSSDGRTV